MIRAAVSVRGDVKNWSKEFRVAVRSAVVAQTDELYLEAKKLTRTRYLSKRDLRRMGHPYSKRWRGARPYPANQPHILNKQTGLLYASWVKKVGQNQYGYYGNVSTKTRYTKYLAEEDNSKRRRMIARPIRSRVLRLAKRQFVKRLRSNFRKMAA